MKSNSIKRFPFTLIELLVIISILAILMSMLLPALNKAMEESRKIQCAMQMGQIMKAEFQYAGESDDYITPHNIGKSWAARVNRGWWVNLLASRYLPVPGWTNSFPGVGTATQKEEDGDVEAGVFRCPSVRSTAGWGGGIGIPTDGTHVLVSYGRSIRLSQIKYSSRWILIGDSIQVFSSNVPSRCFYCPCQWDKYSFEPRHRGLACGVMLDGHYESRKKDGWRTAYPCNANGNL